MARLTGDRTVSAGWMAGASEKRSGRSPCAQEDHANADKQSHRAKTGPEAQPLSAVETPAAESTVVVPAGKVVDGDCLVRARWTGAVRLRAHSHAPRPGGARRIGVRFPGRRSSGDCRLPAGARLGRSQSIPLHRRPAPPLTGSTAGSSARRAAWSPARPEAASAVAPPRLEHPRETSAGFFPKPAVLALRQPSRRPRRAGPRAEIQGISGNSGEVRTSDGRPGQRREQLLDRERFAASSLAIWAAVALPVDQADGTPPRRPPVRPNARTRRRTAEGQRATSAPPR